jgi:ATP-binding cassette subfamily B protein
MKPLKLFYRLSKKYAFSLILAMLAMLSLVAIQLLIPWLIRSILNKLTLEPISGDTLKFISQAALIALVAYLARALMQFIRSYASHVAGWGVVANARRFVYEHLQKLSMRYYSDKQTGQLMSSVINDTDLFEQMISHAVPDLIVNSTTLIGITIILAGMNWRLTLISLIPIPLIFVGMRLYSRYVRPLFRKRQVALGELNAVLNDNLSGVREIKSFAHEELAFEQVDLKVQNHLELNLRALRLMATFSPLLDLLASIGQLAVIYFGSRMAMHGSLSVPDLVAFYLYLESFYQPVRAFSNSWEAVLQSLAGFERVSEILAIDPEIVSPPNPKKPAEPIQGSISFHNVDFGYQGEDLVLRGINLEIPAGSSFALVGPTGVGKTTFASLIPRFYDVNSGAICVDGIDVRDWDLDQLHQTVGMVLQDVFLFNASVRQNILFGKPEATEAELIQATKIANAWDFIQAMPEGLDTRIGERGVKLSGGQKQRISIARAVLKDSPILILDEATSAVDTETEMLIQEALERLIQGRTTIIIAHRLSTVRNADKIVVLENGQVREIGTHSELLANQGLYHRLYTVQQRLS